MGTIVASAGRSPRRKRPSVAGETRYWRSASAHTRTISKSAETQALECLRATEFAREFGRQPRREATR